MVAPGVLRDLWGRLYGHWEADAHGPVAPTTLAYGDAPSAGASGREARLDHVHGMPAAGSGGGGGGALDRHVILPWSFRRVTSINADTGPNPLFDTQWEFRPGVEDSAQAQWRLPLGVLDLRARLFWTPSRWASEIFDPLGVVRWQVRFSGLGTSEAPNTGDEHLRLVSMTSNGVDELAIADFGMSAGGVINLTERLFYVIVTRRGADVTDTLDLSCFMLALELSW